MSLNDEVYTNLIETRYCTMFLYKSVEKIWFVSRIGSKIVVIFSLVRVVECRFGHVPGRGSIKYFTHNCL